MNEPSIGLLMVVRNEAHRIRDCLDWHLPYFDEVAICDQESDDGTWKILQKYQKKSDVPFHLLRDEPRGFPEPSKEMTKEALSTDWILLVDADEKYNEKFLNEMKELIKNHGDEFDAFRVPRDNIFEVKVYDEGNYKEPKWLEVKHPARDPQVRLSHKSKTYYPPKVHVRLRVADKEGDERIKSLSGDYRIEHRKTVKEQWDDNARYRPMVRARGDNK